MFTCKVFQQQQRFRIAIIDSYLSMEMLVCLHKNLNLCLINLISKRFTKTGLEALKL